MRPCVFCKKPFNHRGYDAKRNPDGRALEHAYPKWLQTLLGVNFEQLEEQHTGPRTGALTSSVFDDTGGAVWTYKGQPRRMLYESRQHGGVCGRCNTGWMNKLEGEARPILAPLILGERSVASVTWLEGEILARWTLKTAVVISDSAPGAHPVPVEYGQLLCQKGELPTGGALFTGSTVAALPKADRFLGPNWIVRGVSSQRHEIEPLVTTSFKAAFKLGRLHLLFAHWPLTDWLFTYWQKIHTLVWPRTARAFELPTLASYDGDDAFEAFYWGLNVAQHIAFDTEEIVSFPGGFAYAHEIQAWKASQRMHGDLASNPERPCPCKSGRAFKACHGNLSE